MQLEVINLLIISALYSHVMSLFKTHWESQVSWADVGHRQARYCCVCYREVAAGWASIFCQFVDFLVFEPESWPRSIKCQVILIKKGKLILELILKPELDLKMILLIDLEMLHLFIKSFFSLIFFENLRIFGCLNFTIFCIIWILKAIMRHNDAELDLYLQIL